MPVVLVTGVSGFLATHVALSFLEHGYTVRGTVRSAKKGDAVKALPCFKDYQDKLEYAVVEDVAEGDFSEALKGVDAVAHTASPFNMTGETWEKDYKEPAVKGTKNVLEAAAKVSSVKHVVLTSSFASIGDFSIPAEKQSDKTYTEEDWNPVTDEACKAIKSDDPNKGGVWYCASKTLAEKAAYEVAEKSSFTLGTVCPPMIFGPPLQKIESLDSLNTSTAGIYSLMKEDGSSVKDGVPPTAFPLFADVRNVADAHYEIIARGKSGRFAITSGTYTNQMVATYLRENFPDIKDRVPEGKPEGDVEGKYFGLSAAKAEKELGLKFIKFEKTIHDTVQPLLDFEKSQKA